MRRNAGGNSPPAAPVKLAESTAPVDQQTIAWPAPSAVPPTKPAAARNGRAARRRRPNWRDAALRDIAAKPLRDKLSELLGSMIVAALVATVAACIGPMVLGSQPGSERFAMYFWLATIGTLGSWAILVPAKLTEGKLEDQVPMRVTLLAAGATVGVAAWLLGEALLLKSPGWHDPIDAGRGLISQEMLEWPSTHRVRESLAARVCGIFWLLVSAAAVVATSGIYSPRADQRVVGYRVGILGLGVALVLVVPATDRPDGRRRDRHRHAAFQPLDAAQPPAGIERNAGANRVGWALPTRIVVYVNQWWAMPTLLRNRSP